MEVHCAKVQPSLGPRIEVVLHSYSTAASCRLSDGDVLVEGRRANNGRLVDALVLPDGVGASVTGERTLLRAARGDSNVGLHDIILNKGVRGPPVDGKTTKTAGDIEGAGVVNGTKLFASD